MRGGHFVSAGGRRWRHKEWNFYANDDVDDDKPTILPGLSFNAQRKTLFQFPCKFIDIDRFITQIKSLYPTFLSPYSTTFVFSDSKLFSGSIFIFRSIFNNFSTPCFFLVSPNFFCLFIWVSWSKNVNICHRNGSTYLDRKYFSEYFDSPVFLTKQTSANVLSFFSCFFSSSSRALVIEHLSP